MKYKKLSHYILSLLLSSALLCGCNKHPMAAMSEEENSLQESVGGITILEAEHLEAMASARVPATIYVVQEAAAHGSSTIQEIVGVPDPLAVTELQASIRGNRARKKVIGQQNAALLAGAAALGGYVTNSLFTWHSASKQQEKQGQEHQKLVTRIRTLEEALSLRAMIDVDTTPISQASDATCVSGTRLFVPPIVSASQVLPVGLCTLLAGGYIARKIQCYRNSLAAVARANETESTAIDQAMAQTSHALAASLRTRTFGEAEWKHYFGDVGSAPPLPSDMATILDGPCPFWPDQLVKDTHLLVLIPATVGGVPFTLNRLGELIKDPSNGGHRTKYSYYHERVKAQIGEESPPRAYWVLMTRDVFPGSRSEGYARQKKLVAGYASREGVPYALPSVLEAATAILMHHAREGERLFGDDPWAYTRCQEVSDGCCPAVVGGFESSGLDVHYDYSGSLIDGGAACCRKF
jgi:hypothetical protein